MLVASIMLTIGLGILLYVRYQEMYWELEISMAEWYLSKKFYSLDEKDDGSRKKIIEQKKVLYTLINKSDPK